MSGMTAFRSFNNSACKKALEVHYLRLGEVVVKRTSGQSNLT